MKNYVFLARNKDTYEISVRTSYVMYQGYTEEVYVREE